jgi:hypothetical protein
LGTAKGAILQVQSVIENLTKASIALGFIFSGFRLDWGAEDAVLMEKPVFIDGRSLWQIKYPGVAII